MSIVSLVIAPTLAHVYHTKDNSGIHTDVIKEKTPKTAANTELYKAVKMEENNDGKNQNLSSSILRTDGAVLSSNTFIKSLKDKLTVDYEE